MTGGNFSGPAEFYALGGGMPRKRMTAKRLSAWLKTGDAFLMSVFVGIISVALIVDIAAR